MKAGDIELDGFTKYHKPEGRIVILGFGSVGQTVLPLVVRHFEIDPTRVLVIDKRDHPLFKKWSRVVKFLKCEITKDNMGQVLESVLKPGDFLVNVSLNIDGIEIVKWCLDHEVMYLDTSIERWPDEQDETIPDPAERTLYSTHQEIRQQCAGSEGKATAIVTNGANPGLVTYLAKRALLHAAKLCGVKLTGVPQHQEGWAALAEACEIRVIQIAERDTQVLKTPKTPNVFCNTWSCEGFWAEGRAPSEMGWGTHEDPSGPRGGAVQKTGPGNGAYINRPGVSVLVNSWVPRGGQFNGMLVQHSEAITLSEYLTTKDGKYRPTVYYAYQPTDAALCSVHEMRGHELKFHSRTRILKNSILEGRDELGVLLLGPKIGAYWYGSQLDIHEARKLIPGESATSLQVGASILGAMVYAYKNPKLGYREPESLPHEEVLKVAEQYLGPLVGKRSNWHPQKRKQRIYDESSGRDPWDLNNFLVDPV